jgi:TolB protein
MRRLARIGQWFFVVSLVTSVLWSCRDSPPTEPKPPPTGDQFAPELLVSSLGGGKIAFWSTRDGRDQIYVMNPDGTNQTNVSNSQGGSVRDRQPAWSPDGNEIAFASNRDANWEIYVMNSDGSGQTNVTNTPSRQELHPTWSPAGDMIAFAAGGDIWTMSRDGTGVTNLTPDLNGGAYTPDWSPDGSEIVFQYQASLGELVTDIYVVATDGSGATNLTETFLGILAAPDWSADGRRIAFTALPCSDGEVCPGPQGIYVMNANGSNIRLLAASPGSSQGFDWPEWSPDDSKIAFAAYRDANWEIYVMNSDGSGQTRLTDNLYGDNEPSWQYQPRNATEAEVTVVSFDDANHNGSFDTGEDRDGSYILIETQSGVRVDDCLSPCQLLLPPTQGYYVWQLQEPNWDLLDITLDAASATRVDRPPDEAEAREFVGTALVVDYEDDPHTVVFRNVQPVRLSQIQALLEDAWIKLLLADMTDTRQIDRQLETTLDWLQRTPPRLDKVADALADLEAAIADGDPADAVHLAYLQLVVDHCQTLVAQLLGA